MATIPCPHCGGDVEVVIPPEEMAKLPRLLPGQRLTELPKSPQRGGTPINEILSPDEMASLTDAVQGQPRSRGRTAEGRWAH